MQDGENYQPGHWVSCTKEGSGFGSSVPAFPPGSIIIFVINTCLRGLFTREGRSFTLSRCQRPAQRQSPPRPQNLWAIGTMQYSRTVRVIPRLPHNRGDVNSKQGRQGHALDLHIPTRALVSTLAACPFTPAALFPADPRPKVMLA